MKAMMGMMLAAACVLPAACGPREGAGGLTAEEERQLDEAARMLDENMIDVSPDSLVANEAEIEAIEANQGAPTESPSGNMQ